MVHQISTAELTLADINAIISEGKTLKLSEEATKRIVDCHGYLYKKIEKSDAPIYGINTGFGSLYKVSISREDLEQLQVNLVMSHACGAGEEVPQEIVKLMLLLKIQSLAYGHSAVQLETVERLIQFYNRGIYPVVYQQGSLGASGDLAPLAHLCLPLLGLGEVNYQGYRLSAADAMSLFSWAPLALQAKEGLALLNGTQFMLAYAVDGVLRAQRLAAAADVIGALSTEAFGGCTDPFHENLHRIRPHAGQVLVAR